MSTKLAADVLDEVLAGALSRMSVGERDGPDDVAMDKKEFVVGILELIKVCVDRLRRNFALSETTYPSRKADDIFLFCLVDCYGLCSAAELGSVSLRTMGHLWIRYMLDIWHVTPKSIFEVSYG